MNARKALETLLEGAFENEELELFVARLPQGIDVLDEVGEPGAHGDRYPQMICRELVDRGLVDDTFFRALAALKPDRAEEVDFAAGLVYQAMGPMPSTRRVTAPGTRPPVRPAVPMSRPRTPASTSRTRVRAVSHPATRLAGGARSPASGRPVATIKNAPSLLAPSDDENARRASIATRNLVGESLFFYVVAGVAFVLHLTAGLHTIADFLGSGLSDLGPGPVPGGDVSWLVTATLLAAVSGTVLLLFAGTGESGDLVIVPGRALGIAGALYLGAAVPYGVSFGAARPVVLIGVGLVTLVWCLTGPLNSRAGTARAPYWLGTALFALVLAPLVLGAP